MAAIDDITNLYTGYFNRAPDPAGLNFWIAQRAAGASLAGIAQSFAQVAESTSLYSYLAAPLVGNPVAFLNSVYLNLFGRSIDAAGQTYWTAQLANPAISVGRIIIDIISGAQGNDALVIANKQAVGKAFVQKVVDTNAIFNLSLAKNAFTGVTSDAATVATATTANNSAIDGSIVTNSSQLFRLSENVDIKAGGATNDTFDGSRVTTPAGQLQTLNNADNLDGGAGTDTVFAQLTANVTPAGFKGIEILDVEAQANVTVDLNTGDSALTTIKSSNSGANNLTVINIQSAPTNFVISNGSGNFTATVVASKLAGTSDAATIDLNTVTGGTVVLGNTGAGGYETLNVNSNGTVANVLAGFGDGAATTLSTVNIAGAAALTLPLTDASVSTVNASTMTGVLNLTVAAGSGAQTITGGAGNDLINMNGTYTALDILNGGAGTDSLVLSNAEAIAAVTVQANVTNFEVVRLSDGLNGAVTPGNFGVANLRFGAAMAGAGTVNYAAGATNVLDLQNFGSGGFALTANIAGTATNDVLGLTVGSTTAGNAFGAGNVTINGAETVNLLSQGGANTFGGTFTITDTAASQALIITGTQSLTFTGAVRADTIDASGTAGPLASLVLTGGTGTTATSITGTANADTLIGSTAGDIINGGGGNDTIANVLAGTATTAGDQITGGAGFDNITLRGDLASEAVATAYGKAAFVTDFTVGSTAATTDIVTLSSTNTNYSGAATGFHAGIAAATAVAAGATVIQTVAQNAAAAALIAGTDLIKLTTGVATTGLTVQQAFNAAIGTGTVTGLGAGTEAFVSFYDTTNSRAVFLVVDANSGTNTVVETGDTVTLIGTVAMSSTDYGTFSSNNFALAAN
jgi:hypothetical protein